MFNLYSVTKGPQAIRDFARAMRDTTGNLPPVPGVFPDYFAPIVRNTEDGKRQLVVARWGMSSPQFILADRKADPGVTNVRNAASSHWRRWLGERNRCVVPATLFCEYADTKPRQYAINRAEPAPGSPRQSARGWRRRRRSTWRRLRRRGRAP